MQVLLLFVLCCQIVFVRTIISNLRDNDLYGLKVAINEVLFAQVNTQSDVIIVQYTPYNYTFNALECYLIYDSTLFYAYSVGVGSRQNSTLNTFFYFSGEVVSSGYSGTDQSGHNGTFIGLWINQDPQDIQFYSANRQFLPCDFFHASALQFLSSYGHQEYFVMAVEPYGQYAFGLATDFVFRYRPFTVPTMTTRNGIDVWPNNATFYPCAADTSDTFTVVSGFVKSSTNSRVRATPTVYLMLNSNLTIISTWSYTANNNSWQSRLTYSTVSSWSKQNTMSVKINMNDGSRVLVGMPFLNTVFMFVVNSTSMTLSMVNSRSIGQAVGYGKSVSWLSANQAAILVSIYTSDYQTWISSQVFVYTTLNGTDVPSTPVAIIPNAQQRVPATVSAQWIRTASTASSLVVLDGDGRVFMLLTEQPGYYASTTFVTSADIITNAIVSRSTPCIGGTFKSDTGVHPCSLCPSRSRNLGGIPASTCSDCSANSFCPLGAVFEVNATAFVARSQTVAYPRSPEMTIFEDVLLHNMFTFGPTGHCLAVSPIFWSLILLLIVTVLLISMASLNFCVQLEKRERWRTNIWSVFQRTDLVVRC